MADINCTVIEGRLTKDLELKYTNSGMAVGSGSIAVNRSIKRNDQWVDEVSFFNFVLWGKRAEGLSPYMKKGKKFFLQCHLKQDRWEKDGNQYQRVILEVDNVSFGPEPKGSSGGSNNVPADMNEDNYSSDKFEDDIPF